MRQLAVGKPVYVGNSLVGSWQSLNSVRQLQNRPDTSRNTFFRVDFLSEGKKIEAVAGSLVNRVIQLVSKF